MCGKQDEIVNIFCLEIFRKTKPTVGSTISIFDLIYHFQHDFLKRIDIRIITVIESSVGLFVLGP